MLGFWRNPPSSAAFSDGQCKLLERLTPASLAVMIDHTFLKPCGTPNAIERLCCEALEYGFAMVAINPAEVSRCVELLKGTKVGIEQQLGSPWEPTQ